VQSLGLINDHGTTQCLKLFLSSLGCLFVIFLYTNIKYKSTTEIILALNMQSNISHFNWLTGIVRIISCELYLHFINEK